MKTHNIASRILFISFTAVLAFFVLVFAKETSGTWVAPASAAKLKNPVQPKQASFKVAKKIYSQQCVTCHGKNGEGDGPAAKFLGVKVADLTSARVQNQTDGEIFWKLTNGKTPMPTFKSMLSEQQRWELVNYIRTLKSK